MIRMARRAFTLGEVVLVAHGATALFLETVNISIMKVSTLYQIFAGLRASNCPLFIAMAT